MINLTIVIIRTLIVYFALLIFMRLMGKRQLSELELPEFAVAVLIADLGAHPLQDIGIPLLNGLLPIVVLFCCEVLISGAAMSSPKLRSALFGRPSFLIREGKIDQREMQRNRFTPDELAEQLRSTGYLAGPVRHSGNRRRPQRDSLPAVPQRDRVRFGAHT